MARKNTISYPIKPQPPTTLDYIVFSATKNKTSFVMQFGTQKS